MVLLVTDPHENDYYEYVEMNQDLGLRKEFLNLREQNIQNAHQDFKNILELNRKPGSTDFAFIKIASAANADNYYDSSNSKIIGFIVVGPAGESDFRNSGFQTLLNYGMIEKYRNKGLMTHALNLRLSRYMELEFNIIPAYVKGNNPASEKILRKCGFIRVDENDFFSTYVKQLCVDDYTFKNAFQPV
jgi:RimJ/RimL family protein N-acetyltransferase